MAFATVSSTHEHDQLNNSKLLATKTSLPTHQCYRNVLMLTIEQTLPSVHAIRIVYDCHSVSNDLSASHGVQRFKKQLTFTTPPHPTTNPHPTIQQPSIPLIPRLQLNRQSERILARIHTVRKLRIKQPLQNFSRPGSPPGRLHRDESWIGVVGAEQVVGRDEGVQGGGVDELGVLASGLDGRIRDQIVARSWVGG